MYELRKEPHCISRVGVDFFLQVRWLLHSVDDGPDNRCKLYVRAVELVVVWCERHAVTYTASKISNKPVSVVVVHKHGKGPC